MRSITVVFVVMLLLYGTAFAQAPDTLWTRVYGAVGTDYGYGVQQTTDGGFIVGGWTSSYGAPDFYLLKTDANGDTTWSKRYGGMAPDEAFCVEQCSDGGYIMGGYTFSYGAGAMDFYAVKTDVNGDTVWTHTYGGPAMDPGECIQPTSDGGFIFTGSTGSYGAGGDDVYLVKTNSVGVAEWTQTFGGTAYDAGYWVQQTADGGYIVSGATSSFGAGAHDVYLIKTNSLGAAEWTHTYGGSGSDYGYGVQQTTDGGYIIAGATASFGSVPLDVYVIKTDSNGDTLWTRTFGGGGINDFGESVQQTSDGGYIIAGYTESFGAGYIDVYLIKINSAGDMLWMETFGGTESDQAYCVQQISDGGYIVAGQTMSFGAGNMDFYIIRLEAEASPVVLTLTPQNPPIQIPSGGGSFNFDIEVANNSANLYTIDVGLNVTLPGGSVYPIYLRNGISLGAGASVIREDLTQFVPAGAPVGNYTYDGYVYDNTSWEILAEDHFDFEKLSGDGIPLHNRGWALYGWDDESSTIASVPADHIVISAYPNPFNPETTLSFNLPDAGYASLVIYDIQGREVATLIDGFQSAGDYQVRFNAANLSSGIYYAKLTTNGQHQIQKLLLLK